MASLRSCLILAAGLPLAIAGGCASTHENESAWISPGAMYAPQDENYEIKGKPESGGGAQAGTGYGGAEEGTERARVLREGGRIEAARVRVGVSLG